MMKVDVEKLETLGIRNLHSVFGRGARGETLAKGCHMAGTVDRLMGAGVSTVVDLRTADHNDKLSRKCRKTGLDYIHIPIDAHATSAEDIRQNLPRLFSILDGDGFYVSCQQGLHRTDIALALYYFFHNPGIVPEMIGHRMKGGFRCDDIMRRVNAMRPLFGDLVDDEFAMRRRTFLERQRKDDSQTGKDERNAE